MSVASILEEMAQNAGRARLQRGAVIGDTIAGISQVPGQILADREKHALLVRQQAAEDARARYAKNADTRAGEDQARQTDAAAVAKRKDNVNRQAWVIATAGAGGDPAKFNIQAAMDFAYQSEFPDIAQVVHQHYQALQKPVAAPIIVKPGERGFDPLTHEPIAGLEVPPNAPAPRPVTYGAPAPVMIGGKRVLVRPGSDGAMYGMDGAKVPTANVLPDVPPRSDNEPLVAIMGDDGHPVLVPRSRAVGKRPASTREQGRPVTSGDAGRIAEIDNSLDDIGRLGAAIAAAGETGTVAKIGASAPNWVTDLTGWGTDAKKKQALIDRVKQVIGKALEGGVLRKEDELKYEKILPTIADTNAVVTSKLSGLDTAIRGKRERTVESLTDAGYDTAKFGRTEKAAAPKDGDTKPIDGFPGTEQTFKNGKWIRTK